MSTTKYFLFLLFASLMFSGISQEIINEKPHNYESEDGKYYIQKHQPVYIYLSNSPDSNATKYRLKSKKSAQFTNPMQFDADGFNSLRTYWAADKKQKKVQPEKEIIFEVYADSKPPETYGLFDKNKIGYKEGKRIYPSGTRLSLLEYDAVSGTSKIYFSINDKPFSIYHDFIEFSDSGKISLKYYGIDNVGNMEELHILEFFIQ